MTIHKVEFDYGRYGADYKKILLKVEPIEVRESKSTYIREGLYGNGRIRKDDVLNLEYDSNYSLDGLSAKYGHLVIFCLEQDIENAKNKMKKDILMTLTNRRNALNEALEFLAERLYP